MWRRAPGSVVRRAQWLGLGLALWAPACTPEFEKLDQMRSDRGTLGEEVYKALCRRVAGTEMPSDIDGSDSEVLCLGAGPDAAAELDARRSELPPRLVVLADRRALIVQAVDDVFPGELSDELEHLMRKLIPFYDPPEERIQKGTRLLAALLEKLAADPAALDALQRVARDGMLPAEGTLGLVRAPLAHPGFEQMLSVVLDKLTADQGVKPHFETLLAGLALELATTELEAEPDSDTRQLKDLLRRASPEAGSGRALLLAERDARGMPVPTPLDGVAVPFPFVDADRDGLADVAGSQFVTDPLFVGPLPEPFSQVLASVVERDELGCAYAYLPTGEIDRSRTLFVTRDADPTLLAGALREAGKLFAGEAPVMMELAKIVPMLFGPPTQTERAYGAGGITYQAPDPAQSPFLDLVHAGTALIDRPTYDESLNLTGQLLSAWEPALVAALDPLLTLEKRTRKGDDDAYSEAHLAEDSVFWDELLFEAEKLSRRRKTADGETALEAMLRGSLGYARNLQKPGAPIEQLFDPVMLSHQGAMLATLMRFKDEWRGNPKGESKREPGEPLTLGGFRIPVDRTQPDRPVSCGRDGCGGVIEGTPFEIWAQPNQNCLVQREGRPVTGKDCGQPANQSLFHRSLGLIWEMAGRSQCNKPITLGDLLDFALLEDPCVNLETTYECTADAECVGAPHSLGADYECDETRGQCIAKRNSATCQFLKQQQQQDRQSAIDAAEEPLADDYTCPASKPDAPCHTYEGVYPAAFVDPDGPATGEPAMMQECHLMNLPDVGRAFGRALTHEFQLEIPNPWVRRYLTDVAHAQLNASGDDCTNKCTDPAFDIVDPDDVDATTCVTESACNSRVVYEGMPNEVDTLGELIEFLVDDSALFATPEDTADMRPDVKVLSRVLFAPAGSSSFLVFDPPLIHGAPKACSEAPALPACGADDSVPDPEGGCCLADLANPPLRFRLDTYYGATSFAWEQTIQLTDGSSLSFIDATKSLADAVNRTDYDAEAGDDPKNFEGTDYVFSTLGKLVAKHYDSPLNPLAQDREPDGPFFRTFSNIVSYERLLADALDDGSIVPDQLGPGGQPLFDPASFASAPERHLGLVYHSFGLLQAIDGIDFGPDRDAFDSSADLAEELLSAHALCAPAGGDRRVIDGVGPCDRAVAEEAGYTAPLTYRDGRKYICWNNGDCFDGSTFGHRYPTPIYLVLDALAAVEDRIDEEDRINNNDALDTAYRAGVEGLIDIYAGTSNGQLTDRRLRALVLMGVEYMRERWAAELAAGTLSTLGPELNADMLDLVQNPVFAGGLDMLRGLLEEPAALQELSGFTAGLLGQGVEADETTLRALVAALADALESLPGDESLVALTRAMALGISPNVDSVVQSGGTVQLTDGVLWENLTMLRDTIKEDEGAVLQRVFSNVSQVPGLGTAAERASPAEVLLRVVAELNRATPGAGGSLSAADWQSVFSTIAEVMRDERRGFERLYRIVSCRNAAEDDPDCR